MSKSRRFTIEQNVRFRDLDAMGHVNNATYFTYMEEARKVDFWIAGIGRKSFTFKHAIYRTQDPEWVFAKGFPADGQGISGASG